MRRINDKDSVRDSGFVVIDAGDGVVVKTPISTVDLAYDSGERDITSLIPAVVLSGALHAWRQGRTVWLDFRDLEVEDPEATYHSWSALLPQGLTPSRSYMYLNLAPVLSASTVGPVRIDRVGGVVVYNAKPNLRMSGLISFPTPDAPPNTPFGDSV